MPAIAILLGALLGGGWDESLFGAAVGALIAWLLLRTQRQEAALVELRKALRGALPVARAAEQGLEREAAGEAERFPAQLPAQQCCYLALRKRWLAHQLVDRIPVARLQHHRRRHRTYIPQVHQP